MKEKKYVLKARTGDFISIGESVSIKIESNAFLNKKRNDCHEILIKENPKELDIMEFLLNLHIVLEIGINSFFRNYYSYITTIDCIKKNHTIDEINFKDKIKFFLISNIFIFNSGEDKININKKSEQIIQQIITFSQIRNKIIHGHSVSETDQEKSKLRKKLTNKSMTDQITIFKEIISSLNFFIGKVESKINKKQIEMFQKNFLSDNFLNLK
jgi:hypothetical protein